MKNLRRIVRDTFGFVIIDGKWIPRAVAWEIVKKLSVVTDMEGWKLQTKITQALLEDKTNKK